MANKKSFTLTKQKVGTGIAVAVTLTIFASAVLAGFATYFTQGGSLRSWWGGQRDVCAQVITPAENPAGTRCKNFSTPCDVPTGWVRVASCSGLPGEILEPGPCAQVITYAKDPISGECRSFPTPCDVPDGWISCSNLPPEIPK